MSDKGVVIIGLFAAVVEKYFLATDRLANDEDEAQSPRSEEGSMVHRMEDEGKEKDREGVS